MRAGNATHPIKNIYIECEVNLFLRRQIDYLYLCNLCLYYHPKLKVYGKYYNMRFKKLLRSSLHLFDQ